MHDRHVHHERRLGRRERLVPLGAHALKSLRHYLDMEQGNLFRALGRYNGSLGRPEYPNMVLAAWRHWEYTPAAAGVVKTSHETATR